MIRRIVRITFGLGLLAGLGVALFKLVQNRRASGGRMPSGDSPVSTPRSQQPLVDPSMLQGLDVRKPPAQPGVDEAEDEDGQRPPERVDGQITSARTPAATPAAPPPPAAAPAPGDRPAAAAVAAAPPWIEPQGTTCPASHPVKAKLASGIFHLPGMTAYERTTPDRCYLDEAAAEADGLRKAKR